MTTIFIKLLLVSLSYVLVFGYECGISYNQENPNSYTFNGGDLEGDWPWIVAIFHNGSMICTGSIISSRFVLTAAHCYNKQIQNKKTKRHSFSIHAGAVNATEGEAVRVKKIWTFDEAVSEIPRNDIAVFELEQPLVFNHNVSSICLPKIYQESQGNMAYIAGFGNVVYEDHDPNYAENNVLLNDVSIPFQDFKYCESVSQYWNYTSLNYICAGSRMKGSYVGDSGGPIMIKDLVSQQGKLKYRWVAVGVVVGGDYLLSSPNDPLKWSHTLYTRVSHYCDWIENITDGEAQCIDVGMHPFLTTKSTFTTKNWMDEYTNVYIGCYVDDGNERLLPVEHATHDSHFNSVTNCIKKCSTSGFRYAGVQAREFCFCGNSLNLKIANKVTDDTQCEILRCPGDHSQWCGGLWLMNVFQIEYTNNMYIGCYVDDESERLLPLEHAIDSLFNSVTNCINKCSTSGFRYAGVQAWQWCICGNSLNLKIAKKVDDAQCEQLRCPGDHSQWCGGLYLMNVFQIEKK